MEIFEIMARNWKPGIGDPTFMGWFTVVAYFAAAGLLLYKRHLAISLYPTEWSRHRFILLLLALLMFAMGINNQLDLQTWFTNVGREMAEAQGWYEKRRLVQALVLLAIAAIGVLITWAILRMRGVMRSHRLALFGMLLVVGFVAMRASSFFKVDRLLGFQIGGLQMNWILELSAIAVVIWSVVTSLHTLRKALRVVRAERREVT